MDVLINTVAAANPGACNHVNISVTIAGQTFVRQFTRAELQADPDQDNVQAFLAVCRSLIKEAGATTPAQIKALLEGRTVKL